MLSKLQVTTHLKTDEPLKFYGTGAIEAPVADQFVRYQFPLPGEIEQNSHDLDGHSLPNHLLERW